MRQKTPHGRWQVVALEPRRIAPHTEPTFNTGRPSRRRIVRKLLFGALTVAMVTGQGIAGQAVHQGADRQGGRGSIQGVWQTVEVTITGPRARTIAIPEPRPNLTIITARHYSRVEVQAEGPRPIPADVTKASADELRAVWGPFVGEAGTYELTTDNRITMRPIAAKNPAVMGPTTFITYSYKLDGDTMWVTQERNQNGPFASPATIKVVRIE